MSIRINQDGAVRNVSSATPAKAKHNGRMRTIYVIKMKVGERLYTLWELIIGYIFSSDNFAIQTKDGYMVKFKE